LLNKIPSLIFKYFSYKSKTFLIIASSSLVLFFGLIDYITGYEISISTFYLIPISLSSWFISRKSGSFFSLLCTLVWFLTDYTSGIYNTHYLIILWNSIMRFIVFLIFTYSLSALKSALANEVMLARTDSLTGVANQRYFFEMAGMEVYKASRYKHPITLAYLDVDNFKDINDKFGHLEGDKLLKIIAETIKKNIRVSDMAARLGGDEFAILLPETGGEQAKAVVKKAQESLSEVMRDNGWKITFSIGVITHVDPQITIDDILKLADELMYSVKTSGKNKARYRVFF
jgi:diguanylate cyclase (GGDEF)-like protein